MFTDTHAHLNRLDLEKYQGDIRQALQAAKDANVQRIMAIMCELDEYDAIYEIINTKIDGLTLGMSVGVHPCEDIAMLQSATVETLVEMANQPHVWAIGETGLDYYWSTENSGEQKASFVRHIHASQERIIREHLQASPTAHAARRPGCRRFHHPTPPANFDL